MPPRPGCCSSPATPASPPWAKRSATPSAPSPTAIQLALAITVAVYATIAVTILAVLGPDGIAAASAPLAAAVEAGTWDWAVPVVRASGAAAALGALLGWWRTSPRSSEPRGRLANRAAWRYRRPRG